MGANPISKSSIEWLGAASDIVAITPHATTTFKPTRGVMTNSGGNIACKPANSESDVTLTLTAGAIYPISIEAVRITGTTATGIFALY